MFDNIAIMIAEEFQLADILVKSRTIANGTLC